MKIISLGQGAYVDAEEIVAVDQHEIDNEYTMSNFEDYSSMKAAVLLKNGCVIPAWVKPQTIKKRWQEALREEQ